MPSTFEVNRDPTDSDVQYLARSSEGVTVALFQETTWPNKASTSAKTLGPHAASNSASVSVQVQSLHLRALRAATMEEPRGVSAW